MKRSRGPRCRGAELHAKQAIGRPPAGDLHDHVHHELDRREEPHRREPDAVGEAQLRGDRAERGDAPADGDADPDPAEGRAICLPTRAGRRGNPVLWAKRFFPEIQAVEGDVGARNLIGAYDELICEIPVEDDAAFADIDTPDALAAYRAKQ